MANETMSDRLKSTLGMLEARGIEIKEAPTYNESGDEIVGHRGGELVPFTPKQVPTNIPDSDNSDIRDDYITSRNITHTLIDMAGGALEGALAVAIETQHPKAFSVFNELATTMRGLSKDLLEMQEIYKSITAEKAAKLEASKVLTQNNTTVNLTTNTSLSEVLRAIKDNETADVDRQKAEVIDV